MGAEEGRTVADYIASSSVATQNRIKSSGKCTPANSIGMTIVTGAGIAAALIGSVLDDEVDAETAIKAYDDAVEAITFKAEILDIERGN